MIYVQDAITALSIKLWLQQVLRVYCMTLVGYTQKVWERTITLVVHNVI